MNRLAKILCWGLFFAAASATAHPLGVFSTNTYTRIELAGGNVRLHYVMDIAEIPALTEFRRVDTDGNVAISESERDKYAALKSAELRNGLNVELDGAPVNLTIASCEVRLSEGQGGLKTLRIAPVFDVILPAREGARSLRVSDSNGGDLPGWNDILVRASDGAVVKQSSVSGDDLTNELRSYPPDKLANPPKIRKAFVVFVPGLVFGTQAASLPAGGAVDRARDAFAELISAKELTTPTIIFSLLLAFGLGSLHALSPGHGKTVVAAYLVGSRGTARHAVVLGATVTATHTIGVFALGGLTLFASSFILPERLYPWLSVASGLIVVGIGGAMLFSRVKRSGIMAKFFHGHSHGHVNDLSASDQSGDGNEHDQLHEHAHIHDHGPHSHTHEIPGADGTPVTWKSLLALGVSGGLLPCPSALVVLLSAISLHRVGFGMLLILAFSFGLASLLTGFGLIMVTARRYFERFRMDGPAVRLIPALSAFVITVAGCVITVSSLAQAGIDFSAVSGLFAGGFSAQTPLGGGALSILGLGFVLGLKHALDADHLVAVSTIVSERKGFWSSSIVGALWGLGHTASLLVVGLIVLALNVQIPERLALAMECSVALMLVALGANVLWKIRKGAVLHVHAHDHSHFLHLHPHLHEQPDAHPSVHHHPVRIGKKPFLVGMVHGIAGSAALMLLVLTTISSRFVGLLYIAVFGIGSVGGMFLMSALIGLPFAVTNKHARLNKGVRVAAGVVSLCFGLFLVWQIGFVDGLFL